MARIVELELGYCLDDGLPDDLRRDVESLCHLLCDRIADAAVCLAMFEHAHGRPREPHSMEQWEPEAEAHRRREAELEAEDPQQLPLPDYFEWRTALSERARRDVRRMKWEQRDDPETYQRRVPFIHARSFLHALA